MSGSHHTHLVRIGLAMIALSLIGAAPVAKERDSGENRCGWLVNPTPGNFELLDRDGRWLLASQGGFEAPGFEDMPDMTTAGWVADNGSYGHGCACLKVATNKRSMKVTRVLQSRPLPLARCTGDRSLPKP